MCCASFSSVRGKATTDSLNRKAKKDDSAFLPRDCRHTEHAIGKSFIRLYVRL